MSCKRLFAVLCAALSLTLLAGPSPGQPSGADSSMTRAQGTTSRMSGRKLRAKHQKPLRHTVMKAIRILHAIVPCSAAYFAIVESLLDKLTAAGAAPHRDEHRQMLAEIRETLDRCSVLGAKPKAAELVHALDALVAHEAAIRFRESGDLSYPCP